MIVTFHFSFSNDALFAYFQPPGQPGGAGLGMMSKSGGAGLSLVPQLPVPGAPGPHGQLAGLGPHQMFPGSWPRYAAPGPGVLPGLGFPGPRFNGGGSPPGQGGGRGHGESLSRTNLYIRGLSPHTTDKDLINLCQK